MRSPSRSFHFPYKKIKTEIGIIPYPLVPVQLFTENGLINRDFILDTGADVTTLPKYMAKELAKNLDNLETGSSQGIGDGVVKTWESKVKIRIGDIDFEIPCSFVSSNKIPPLLGKIGIFDRFNLCFDNDKEELILTERQE